MVLTLAAREGLLLSLFSNVAYGGTALAPGALASLFLSAHQLTPTDGGVQTSNETSYPGYARVGIARTISATTWAQYGSQIRNAQTESFPANGGGTVTITHIGLGTLVSGDGFLIDYMQLTTPRVVIPSMVLTFQLEELIYTLR